MALTKEDSVFKTCKQAVCSRGEAAQLCDTHLRAPTIVMGDDEQDGIIAYKRFCGTCDGLRELQGFRANSSSTSSRRRHGTQKCSLQCLR